jgi:TPR repeat protein
VEVDIGEARRWYARAADNGHEDAIRALNHYKMMGEKAGSDRALEEVLRELAEERATSRREQV